MIKGNTTRKLITLIIIVMFLLGTCIIIDYADASEKKTTKKNTKKTKRNRKKSVITITAKPSCQSCHKHRKYVWSKHRFINYCPHCRKYNTLVKNPKNVYEKELTCSRKLGGCDSDYCGVCGHDKCSNYHRHRKYKLIEV